MEIKYLYPEGEPSFIRGMPVNASGGPIPLCVLHQLNPDFEFSKASSFVIGGLSVCVDHLEQIVKMLKRGHLLNDIVETAVRLEVRDNG